MDSLRINVAIHGQEISFEYSHQMMDSDAWAAKIIDECQTIEENLLAVSPDQCLEALVPFLNQLGDVVSITSETDNPYIAKLQNKLSSAVSFSANWKVMES